MAAALFFPPAARCERKSGPKPRVIRFATADGVGLVADYAPPVGRKPVFVLLHGLGAGRGEWRTFVAALSQRGFGAFALDARGHGESEGPSFQTFSTPRHWGKLEGDLEAALARLEKEGIPPSRIVLGGASIGANLALRAAVRAKAAPFVVLLSPGLEYQGVGIREAMLTFGGPVIIAAAPDDPYAFHTARSAIAWARDKRSGFLRAASGHGVGMLEGEGNRGFVTELLKRIEELTKLTSSSSSGTRASP